MANCGVSTHPWYPGRWDNGLFVGGQTPPAAPGLGYPGRPSPPCLFPLCRIPHAYRTHSRPSPPPNNPPRGALVSAANTPAGGLDQAEDAIASCGPSRAPPAAAQTSAPPRGRALVGPGFENAGCMHTVVLSSCDRHTPYIVFSVATPIHPMSLRSLLSESNSFVPLLILITPRLDLFLVFLTVYLSYHHVIKGIFLPSASVAHHPLSSSIPHTSDLFRWSLSRLVLPYALSTLDFFLQTWLSSFVRLSNCNAAVAFGLECILLCPQWIKWFRVPRLSY